MKRQIIIFSIFLFLINCNNKDKDKNLKEQIDIIGKILKTSDVSLVKKITATQEACNVVCDEIKELKLKNQHSIKCVHYEIVNEIFAFAIFTLIKEMSLNSESIPINIKQKKKYPYYQIIIADLSKDQISNKWNISSLSNGMTFLTEILYSASSYKDKLIVKDGSYIISDTQFNLLILNDTDKFQYYSKNNMIFKAYDVIELYENSLKNSNFDFFDYYFIGVCYLQLMKYDKSIEMHQKAIDKVKNKNLKDLSGVYSNMGNAYISLNQLQKALEMYKMAETINKTDISVKFNIAKLYQKMNKKNEALHYYRLTVGLFKKNDMNTTVLKQAYDYSLKQLN